MITPTAPVTDQPLPPASDAASTTGLTIPMNQPPVIEPVTLANSGGAPVASTAPVFAPPVSETPTGSTAGSVDSNTIPDSPGSQLSSSPLSSPEPNASMGSVNTATIAGMGDADKVVDLGTPVQIANSTHVAEAKAEQAKADELNNLAMAIPGASVPSEAPAETPTEISPEPAPPTPGAQPEPNVVVASSPPPADLVETQNLLNQLVGAPPVTAVPDTAEASSSSATSGDGSASPEGANPASSSTEPPAAPPTDTPADAEKPPAVVKNTSDYLDTPEETMAPGSSSIPNSVVEVLLRTKELTQEQADQLMIDQIRSGKTLEKLIEDKHLVSEEALSKARAQMFGVPFIKITEIGVSPEALTVLPESVARRYNMLPFAYDKGQQSLSVVMKEPLDLTAIDFAEQKTGLRLIVHYAMPSELDRTIAERYAQSLSSEVTQALQETTQVAEQKKQQLDLSNLSGEIVRQAPITKIVETILAFAIKARASDIHIEPLLDRTRVRYRIDGILTEKLILPKSVHEATVSRIKILSDLKIDEKRVPQDGRFNFVTEAQEVDLRVSTLPTIHGEKIVMRLLKKNQTVPTLPELGLRGFALRNVEDSIRVPHGIVLVTGPTGSGKTTTLYSVLHLINTPKVNIMTLEDPVEYQMSGVNQVQINPQAGLSFASGLRSFLRQDPNIIMVGEIRDGETVELAVQASLTGHLVFSTLHTSSAAGALPRLMDMGAEPFLLASSMTCTMAQRIVRCLNPAYKEEYKPEKAVAEDIRRVLGNRYDLWCKQHAKDPNDMTLFRTTPDRPQTDPEYKGRMGIFEVMKITEEISKMIMERKSAMDIEKVAIKDGMLLMKEDGYLKALDGITTIEEVLRVAQV